MVPAILNWSGGKDSCLALYDAKQSGDWDVRALLTTFQEDSSGQEDRVSHHEVPAHLMKAQAASLGLPLDEIYLPDQPANDHYEGLMRRALNLWTDRGIRNAIFGDIFLQDLRTYREQKLSMAGWTAHFPLWQQNTRDLAHRFIDLGFRAKVVSVDGQKLHRDYCGREFDRDFLNDLPAEADPCGEYGEFHTFVYDGPIFSAPVPFATQPAATRTYQMEGRALDFHFLRFHPTA
ncbi:MAG: adenine nucleotide alpha hydrolase [Leptospiraceae bacterium]|nr:adenine nucleotide alpha hydrolase [Leptospiraceae bacterium]